RREGAPRGRGRPRHPQDVPHGPLAHRRVRQLQRARPRPAGPHAGGAPVQPGGRDGPAALAGRAQAHADPGDQAREQAVRPPVRRHRGRLHHHHALHSQRLQRDAGDGVSRVSRRPRGAGARCGLHRHAAHHLLEDRGGGRPRRRVQRHVRRRVGLGARLGRVARAAGVAGRGPEEAQVRGAAAHLAAAVRRGGYAVRRSVGAALAGAALCVAAAAGAQQQTPQDPLDRAMRDELARSMTELRLDTLPKPYFVAYRIDDIETTEAAASLGSLLSGSDTRTRHLRVELRVGDYEFDNTNFIGMGGGPAFSMLAGVRGGALLPLDDQYQEIRRQLWLATDGAYKRAVEQLAQKRAALQNQTRAEHLPDFAKEPPAVLSDVVPAPPLDRAAAEALVRGLSAAFRAFPEVYSSGVSWSAGVVRTRYLNSEGSAFTRS